eukprot:CAMPEP_0168526000 /NCGR_PEP_ID=MMETSP0405-20121227/11673_1 /TAXON_ID=498012 /ORGANISM="Trichosphaerium sp, Strain Am-I-7 wt" /LENGTH=173 /DNA_ID=CAMNT_0008548691 /DNA_START=1 /DNA_END=519 /DNA_ORIENTATION=-
MVRTKTTPQRSPKAVRRTCVGTLYVRAALKQSFKNAYRGHAGKQKHYRGGRRRHGSAADANGGTSSLMIVMKQQVGDSPVKKQRSGVKMSSRGVHGKLSDGILLTPLQQFISQYILDNGGEAPIEGILKWVLAKWANPNSKLGRDPRRAVLASLSKKAHSTPLFRRDTQNFAW